MKKYLIIGAVIALLLAVVGWQSAQIKKVKADRDKYRTNTETLLQSVTQYQTNDSLNAATVGVLELKLSEYKKYRANDLALIKTLETNKRNLQAVTTAQSQTIIKLRGSVRDSIVYRDNVIIDTLQCLDITDKWFDLHGCTNKRKEFTGTFTNRDSLLIAETVKYKRFLGFLWKTSKVKDRKIDVVSKNPNTKIMGVSFTTIRD